MPVDLGEGMELWKGFFQSPVMGWKPYLNIDGSIRLYYLIITSITLLNSQMVSFSKLNQLNMFTTHYINNGTQMTMSDIYKK